MTAPPRVPDPAVGAQPVADGAERAGSPAAGREAENQPGFEEAGQRPGGGVLAHAQVGGQAAHVGGRRQRAKVVPLGVEGQVLEHGPRHEPNARRSFRAGAVATTADTAWLTARRRLAR